jgi:hypothetical protein|tara:strand:+ start:855 stop:1241 length:387 start_codon:yes stop_codon:yes gene_type:complete
MPKDQDYIAKLERAITQKYGPETINNPRSAWDETREREYISQSQEEQRKFSKIAETKDKVEQDGFLINKKLLTRDHNRTCPVCSTYSFHPRDDLYMTKFECCRTCYISWVEGREDRWLAGWRPDSANE